MLQSTEKKLSANLTLALDWVASEHKQVILLKDTLTDIENVSTIEKEERDLLKSAHVLEYVMKGDYRLSQVRQRLVGSLSSIYKELEHHIGKEYVVPEKLFLEIRQVYRKLNMDEDEFSDYFESLRVILAKGVKKEEIEKNLEYRTPRDYIKEVKEIHLGIIYISETIRKNIREFDAWLKRLDATLSQANKLLHELPEWNLNHLEQASEAMLVRAGVSLDFLPPETKQFILQHPADLHLFLEGVGVLAKEVFKDGLPEIKELITKESWPYIVNLTQTNVGEYPAELFVRILPAIKDLIGKEITWEAAVRDLPKITRAIGSSSTLSNLFKRGLPAIKHLITSEERWSDVVKMIQATGDTAPLVLSEHGLLSVKNLITSEEKWRDIVNMVCAAENQAHLLLHWGLPEIKDLIGKEITWEAAVRDLPKMTQAAGSSSKGLIQVGLHAVKDQITDEKRWSDVVKMVQAVGLGSKNLFQILGRIRIKKLITDEKRWSDIVKITQVAGPRSLVIFTNGLSAIEHLIGKEITWEAAVRDLPKLLQESERDSNATFNGLRNCESIITDEKRWSDVVKMVQAVGQVSGGFLRYLSESKDLITSEERWESIVELVQEIGKDAIPLFRDGLPEIKNLVTEETWPVILRDCSAISRSGGDYVRVLKALKHLGIKAKDILAPDEFLSKHLEIKTYDDLITFLYVVSVAPSKMRGTLKAILADLMTRSFSAGRSDIEDLVPRINSVYFALLQAKNVDNETRFLIRKIATYLPIFGDAQLINRVRQGAIDIQDQSDNFLRPLRSKIHNFPGREDIEIVRNYIAYIEGGNIAYFNEFKALCQKHRIELRFWALERNRERYRYSTLASAKLLYKDLVKLWEVDPEGLRVGKEALASPMELDRAHKKIIDKVLRSLDAVEIDIGEHGDAKHLASYLGDLRFDIHVLTEKTSGDLRKDLHLLDMFLESVEQIAHGESMSSVRSQGINNWEDLVKMINLIGQKAMSLHLSGRSHVFVANGFNLLTEFVKKPQMKTLESGLEYMDEGLKGITDSVTAEFKKVLLTKISPGKGATKRLEEAVSPFYRTGPIFQLGELINVLRAFSKTKEFEEITLARSRKGMRKRMREPGGARQYPVPSKA